MASKEILDSAMSARMRDCMLAVRSRAYMMSTRTGKPHVIWVPSDAELTSAGAAYVAITIHPSIRLLGVARTIPLLTKRCRQQP